MREERQANGTADVTYESLPTTVLLPKLRQTHRDGHLQVSPSIAAHVPSHAPRLLSNSDTMKEPRQRYARTREEGRGEREELGEEREQTTRTMSKDARQERRKHLRQIATVADKR